MSVVSVTPQSASPAGRLLCTLHRTTKQTRRVVVPLVSGRLLSVRTSSKWDLWWTEMHCAGILPYQLHCAVHVYFVTLGTDCGPIKVSGDVTTRRPTPQIKQIATRCAQFEGAGTQS
jgi:hypothetical protein